MDCVDGLRSRDRSLGTEGDDDEVDGRFGQVAAPLQHTKCVRKR
jgi:hypothetical protein